MVDAAGDVTAASTATGVTASAGADGSDLEMTSDQRLEGDVSARVELELGQVGGQTTLGAQATGVNLSAAAYDADLTLDAAQTADAVQVSAEVIVDGPTGRVLGGANVGASATANQVSLAVQEGRLTADVVQSSAAATHAGIQATVQYVPAPAAFATTAASNTAGAVGVVAAQELTFGQTVAAGGETLARTYVSAGNAWEIQASATAAGNNVSVLNGGGSLDVASAQDNRGAVRSEVTLNAWDFGAAGASASGTGNSASFGSNDALVLIDNLQINSGGVEVSAEFTSGGAGYDGYASATAMGNAVSGYACSYCPGDFQADNVQTNAGDVRATATLSATSSRSLVGGATAVGNSATFYTSRPSGD